MRINSIAFATGAALLLLLDTGGAVAQGARASSAVELARQADQLKPGQRAASTSNRNFEGRQGFKGRTHLVSPAMAAAAAIAGHFVDIREWR